MRAGKGFRLVGYPVCVVGRIKKEDRVWLVGFWRFGAVLYNTIQRWCCVKCLVVHSGNSEQSKSKKEASGFSRRGMAGAAAVSEAVEVVEVDAECVREREEGWRSDDSESEASNETRMAAAVLLRQTSMLAPWYHEMPTSASAPILCQLFSRVHSRFSVFSFDRTPKRVP